MVCEIGKLPEIEFYKVVKCMHSTHMYSKIVPSQTVFTVVLPTVAS